MAIFAMNVPDPARPLNQVLHVLTRSLPAYLACARPWASADTDPICEALATLADDERRYALLVAEAIVRLGKRPAPGVYPKAFWDLNDLEPRYLLGRVVACHAGDVESLRACCDALRDVSALRDLADEILGNAQGHLEVLEDLLEKK